MVTLLLMTVLIVGTDPDAIACKNDKLVSCIARNDSHVCLSGDLLLFTRKVGSILVLVVAEGARHSEISAYSAHFNEPAGSLPAT